MLKAEENMPVEISIYVKVRRGAKIYIENIRILLFEKKKHNT